MLDVVIRAGEADRRDLSSLSGMILTSDTGAKIPLSQIAQPQSRLEDTVIWRRQRLPFIESPRL